MHATRGEYTFREMRVMLDRAGLDPLEMTSRHFFKDQGGLLGRTAKAAIDVVGRVRPTLGPSIVVVAAPSASPPDRRA